jgi:hypothetical protein
MSHAMFMYLWIHRLPCCHVFIRCNFSKCWAASTPAPIQKCSPLGGYLGHDALVLAEGSTLREVKMATCTWLGTCARSTLLAPMPSWLRCEGLRAQSESTGFHPTSFQKRSSNRLGSGLKRLWQKIRELLFEFLWVLGGCEVKVHLGP